MNIGNANWIALKGSNAKTVPVFRRIFECPAPVKHAALEITAAGVYEACLNGRRIGRFILAPGWTEYDKYLQVQTYDVTDLLKEHNNLEVTVGNGWFRRGNPPWCGTKNPHEDMRAIMIASLRICYTDGSEQTILSDEQWLAATSNITVSGIYDGESVDARYIPGEFTPVEVEAYTKDILAAQMGCDVIEQENIYPCHSFYTPKGEWVLDFGQNLTGYMAFEMNAHAGEKLCLSTAEVLDRDGNFYTANYRTARSKMEYICKEGHQAYKPRLTFFGFRYLRIDSAPEGFSADDIYAIVLHSDMRRTGWLETSDPMLNRLFQNIVWGQKGNFVDVPTDCPQRDERCGWLGDAQVFARTASYQYDTRRFFRKWLHDVALAQTDDGWIPEVVPNIVSYKPGSAAWSDAVTICPWQMYMTYGEIGFLENQYDSMAAWVDFITSITTTPNLWTGGVQYGDWLGLDSPPGSYKGASDEDLIASAFYAHSAYLVAEAGKRIGRDATRFAQLHEDIVNAFKVHYGQRLNTQTEKVLALQFHLTDEPQVVADALAQQIIDCGTALQTGFVGTPYLLHVLSAYGYTELAYTLLLKKEYPSWLYSVSKGATTIWEHWDGIREDGTFWSDDMNSYNHYAYGSVADWVYGVACGIEPISPGFERVRIAPKPDRRIERMSARIETCYGEVRSAWGWVEGAIRYEITTPVETDIVIGERIRHVPKGSYIFIEQ